ncbi:MAG: class I mannose-6-phosphate isomerase [Lachnospiraceae bacterium]|nr:class I mannose-6-phosphate isomerase [Lachnospiraceae bacterium]MDE7436583.1 class I mannose-6-phosphate isomerase [Lachnospiraceae bacterium]
MSCPGSLSPDSREILFLEPVCTHNIWGGTRLREEFGYSVQGDDIGECWGISAHPNGDGTIKYGAFAGQKLSWVWKRHPEVFGNLNYDRFPLLVKIIDARDDLSIQVHPDDVYAGEHETVSFGKAECWYVLDCPPDAALVIGHNAPDRKALADMIREGRWTEFIREVPVHKGDFIQIDPGTVHAIKGGILLLETQQNSDVTYRVYDYERLSEGKPRELHVQQSIDVITVPAPSAKDSVMHTLAAGDDPEETNQLRELYRCGYYRIFRLEVNGSASFVQEYPFLNMTVTEGSGMINGQPIRKGNHFILPYRFGNVEVQGRAQIIASTVTDEQ